MQSHTADAGVTRVVVLLEGTAVMRIYRRHLLQHGLQPLLQHIDSKRLGKYELALVVMGTRDLYSEAVVQSSGWTDSVPEFRDWLEAVTYSGGARCEFALGEALQEVLYLVSCPCAHKVASTHLYIIAVSEPDRFYMSLLFKGTAELPHHQQRHTAQAAALKERAVYVSCLTLKQKQWFLTLAQELTPRTEPSEQLAIVQAKLVFPCICYISAKWPMAREVLQHAAQRNAGGARAVNANAAVAAAHAQQQQQAAAQQAQQPQQQQQQAQQQQQLLQQPAQQPQQQQPQQPPPQQQPQAGAATAPTAMLKPPFPTQAVPQPVPDPHPAPTPPSQASPMIPIPHPGLPPSGLQQHPQVASSPAISPLSNTPPLLAPGSTPFNAASPAFSNMYLPQNQHLTTRAGSTPLEASAGTPGALQHLPNLQGIPGMLPGTPAGLSQPMAPPMSQPQQMQQFQQLQQMQLLKQQQQQQQQQQQAAAVAAARQQQQQQQQQQLKPPPPQPALMGNMPLPGQVVGQPQAPQLRPAMPGTPTDLQHQVAMSMGMARPPGMPQPYPPPQQPQLVGAAPQPQPQQLGLQHRPAMVSQAGPQPARAWHKIWQGTVSIVEKYLTNSASKGPPADVMDCTVECPSPIQVPWGSRLVIQKLMDQRQVVPLAKAAQHHRDHLHQIRFRLMQVQAQFRPFLAVMTQTQPATRVGIIIEGDHMIVIWYSRNGPQAESQGFFLPKTLGMQLLAPGGAAAAAAAAAASGTEAPGM